MDHLDDAAALALADRPDPGGEQHCACARCRALVTAYRRLLAVLERPDEPTPELPASLGRWALAYARTSAGTAPRRPALLELVARGWGPVAATRGAGAEAGEALLFAGARHQLDLRVEPAEGGGVRLHGQIVPLAGGPAGSWRIGVVTRNGELLTTSGDRDGEFVLEGVERWEGLSVLAEGDDDLLVVPRVGAGPSPVR